MPRGRPRKYTPEEARQAKLASNRKACKKWAAKNDRSEYHRNYDKKRYVKKELVMYRNSVGNARRKGLEHSITEADISIPEICPCCELPIERPSLDRVKNDIGYILSNIQVICTQCNNIKRDGDAKLHRKIADYIDQYG